MITRPLDLATRLRPPPRNFDFLFLVNGALIVLFFGLFGSRFVLSPGLQVENQNFRIPMMPSATDGAVVVSLVISLPRSGMALTDDGLMNYPRLRDWLRDRGAQRPGMKLLVQADVSVPLQDLIEIHEMARAAGFVGVQLAAEPVVAVGAL